MDKFLKINPEQEEAKIVKFIKKTLDQTGLKKVIIALSGGIDSTTSLYLLRRSIPPSNIFVVYLPYFPFENKSLMEIALKLDIPENNTGVISISDLVNQFKNKLQIEDKVQTGNVMARVRMIVLFDLAKKYNGLVCGTENKSEYLLGYFTRFGDEASDFEPIEHLYKNQVYQMAKYLRVPEEITSQKPSANLWIGQTDEEELGFSYEEADPVLYLYFEKKLTIKEIEKQGFKNARKIIETAQKNIFKHNVPYHL